MNILFIAPQPFLVNRGTPIAVKAMTESLGSMGHCVDLLTYHLGETPKMNNVRICRILRNPIKNVPTAFSVNKLILDMPLSLKFFKMVMLKKYDVIHCVEESVFIALFTQWIHGKPCIFDIDSSMPDQLSQKGGILKCLYPFFSCMERWAIRKSLCCITVCTALSDNVRKVAPAKAVFQIEDLPVLPEYILDEAKRLAERNRLGIADCKVCGYMGNFSRYQGIDLMFQAFNIAKGKIHKVKLLIIGGTETEIHQQKEKAQSIGILDNIIFAGRKSPEESAQLIQLADVLLSPRTQGTNTPMKIYSYMASGIPIVATRLWTHTQVLDDNSAVLTKPEPESMADGIVNILEDSDQARKMAQNAAKIIERKYSRERYLEKLHKAYEWIAGQIA